jgi:molybdopterin converting factor small subunit
VAEPDLPASRLTTVTVRYFAAARAAAGTPQEALDLDRPVRVADVLEAAGRRHGPRLLAVLARCSYLLDEVAVRDVAAPVADGATLDVLPPFAGG